MQCYSRLSKCINTHRGGAIEFFDPVRSNSQFPTFFCSSYCERDWVANRLQAHTFSSAVKIPGTSTGAVNTNPAQPHSEARTDSETLSPLSMREVLRIKTMRRLWYSQLISVFGDFLALFAVIGVLTFRLHANPQEISGVQIAYLLPVALLGIFAGVFVDRWPLKFTLIVSDLIRALLVVLLIFGQHLWHFYLVLAAISIVSSFFTPAQGVAIRFVVPLHGLRSANSLMQQVIFGMRILGPAVAGFTVASLGPMSCYLLDSLSFIGSACLIASITFPKPKVDAADRPEPQDGDSRRPLEKVWADIKTTFAFILDHAGLVFVILAMATGMFVIGCFGPLIAIYVRDSLHAEAKIFGFVSPMIGLGLLLGITGLNHFGKMLSNARLVYFGLCGISTGLVILALLPHIWSAALGTLIIGFAVAGIIVPSQTLVQQATPPKLAGRVGSTFMSIVFTAQILGLAISGVLAQHIGVRQVFTECAGLVLALIAGAKLWMKRKTALGDAS